MPEAGESMLPNLLLEVRTPRGLVHRGDVLSVRAEDLDGWFGLRRGRPDLLAVLVAGIFVFEDAQGEAYVANSGGVMNLERGHCRVALRSAVLLRDSEDLAEPLRLHRQIERVRSTKQAELLDSLLNEAMRRAMHGESLGGERA